MLENTYFYIINLERRTDRKEFCKKWLINYPNLSATFYKGIDGWQTDLRKGNLTSGMVACFQTHRSLWQHILDNHKNQRYICIMEDDIFPTTDFHNKLASLEIPDNVDMLNFDWVAKRNAIIYPMNKDFLFVKNSWINLSFYAVKVDSIPQLLKCTENIDLQLDMQLSIEQIKDNINIGFSKIQLSRQNKKLGSDVQIH